MAATSQRANKKGKLQSPHIGHRGGGVSGGGGGGRDYCVQTQHPLGSSVAQPQLNMPGVYSNPDMAYALVGIVGCVVDVQMQSGKAYQGVLQAVSPKLSIALALAHDKTKVMSGANTERLMQLEFADIVSLSALQESNPNLNKDIFKTDAEISHSNGSDALSRELQPFSFDEESSTAVGLNDGSVGWSAEDMFETNRSKFSVESSYDKEMPQYTTKLDRSDTKGYQQREERAARLASEIEASLSSQRHQKMDDGATEVELFSAVVRQDVAPSPSSSKHTFKTNRGGSSKSKTPSTHPHNGLTDDPRPTFSNPDTHSSHSLSETHSTSSFTNTTSTSSPSPATGQVCSLDHQSDLHHADFLELGNRETSQGGSTSQRGMIQGGSTSQRGTIQGGSTSQGDMSQVGTSQGGSTSQGGTSQGGSSQGGSTSQRGTSQGGNSLDSVVSSMEAVRITRCEEDVQVTEEEVEESSDLTSKRQALGDSRLAQEQEVKAVPDLAMNVVPSPTEDVAEAEVAGVPVLALPPGSVAPAHATKDREKSVKQFVLNPAAKQFELNPNAKEFVPPSLSSPLHSLSPMLEPPTTPSSGVKRVPKQRVRALAPSAFLSQDPLTYVSSTSRSYIMSQTPQQMAPMVRLPLHQGQQGMQYSQQYPPSSYLLPPGFIIPQQMMNSPGQKFIEDINNVPIFAAGGYQVPMAMPHQLLQQLPLHGGGQILPPVSQPGLVTSPVGVVAMGNPPSASPMSMMLVQGGLSAQPGATPTTTLYPHMVMPQVGQNQATNADMMGQYY